MNEPRPARAEYPPSPGTRLGAARSRVARIKAWLDANADKVEKLERGSLVLYWSGPKVGGELKEQFEVAAG